MDKIDFRSRGRAAQEALRTQAVYLVRRVGKTQAEAAEAVGVSRQVVNRWLRRHAQGGDEALLDGRRVSPRKGRGLLTVAEAKRVQGWIRDKCPDQLKLPYVLWTTAVVRELIRRKLGKDLAETTVRLTFTALCTRRLSTIRNCLPEAPLISCRRKSMNNPAPTAPLKHMNRISPRLFTAAIIEAVTLHAVRRTTGVYPFGA